MTRRAWLAALAAICLACADDASEQSLDADPGADAGPIGPELPAGLYRVQGLEVDLPFADLAPLGEIVGDTMFVGLGESVHTSGGYSQAKVRLFRYLVEEKGFRAFAFESPWTEADRVAAYVRTCEGDPVEALQGLFGVWGNTSVRDLVVWMCQWNQTHADDPLTFFGFDVQQPWDDLPLLSDFLDRAAPADAEALLARIATCDGLEFGSAADYYRAHGTDTGYYHEDAFEACAEGTAALEEYLTAHEADLIAATSSDDLRWARIALTGIVSWSGEIYFYGTDYTASYEARDAAMAYVFQEIHEIRVPGQKTALWAHNAHLRTEGDAVIGFAFRNMGAYLAAALGEAYQAIGLVGYDVSINWPGIGMGPLEPPTSSNAVEKRLHDLGEPYLLVDLDFPGAAGSPFLESGAIYQLGGQGGSMVPRDQYRALLFLDHSPPMDALFW